MSLIACPDCAKQISDAAPACPNCGRPNASATATTPVLIEQTRKSYKKGMVLGIFITVVGFFSALPFGGDVGLFIVCTGVLVFVVSVIAAWWNHG